MAATARRRAGPPQRVVHAGHVEQPTLAVIRLRRPEVQGMGWESKAELDCKTEHVGGLWAIAALPAASPGGRPVEDDAPGPPPGGLLLLLLQLLLMD
jgi:hypothetical protein